jgi:hypothetical protein
VHPTAAYFREEVRSKPFPLGLSQAQEDAAAVKRSADRETASFEAEWRQLSKLIEADRKLQVQHSSCKSGISTSTPQLVAAPACSLWAQKAVAMKQQSLISALREGTLCRPLKHNTWLQETTRAKEVEERDKRTALLLSGADAVASISTATPPGTPPQPSLARKVRRPAG